MSDWPTYRVIHRDPTTEKQRPGLIRFTGATREEAEQVWAMMHRNDAITELWIWGGGVRELVKTTAVEATA